MVVPASESCLNSVIQMLAGIGHIGAFFLTVDVGQNNNIFIDLDKTDFDLVSGTQQVQVAEPASLSLLAAALTALALVRWRRETA